MQWRECFCFCVVALHILLGILTEQTLLLHNHVGIFLIPQVVASVIPVSVHLFYFHHHLDIVLVQVRHWQ